MGALVQAGLEGGEQILLVGIRMTGAGDGAIFTEGLDQCTGAWQLGGEGHLGDERAVFQNGSPFFGGGVAAVIGVLRAGSGLVDERAFHVHADDAGATQ